MTSEVREPPSVVRAPPPPKGPALRRLDYGAFRALEPGTHEVLLLRPQAEGLSILGPGFDERLVRWSEVDRLQLLRTPQGPSGVPTARVVLLSGEELLLADALAPGSASLPFALEPGGTDILRVERFRMLTSTIVSGAELEPERLGCFGRGPRGLPVPELAIRRRVLPTWAPPLLLVASVLVMVFFFHLTLASAVGVTLILLAHEIGHVVAMRLGGTKVRGVLFLPFVGAATLAEHAFVSRWHEFWVQLAGPLTGIPSAALALILWRTGVLSEATGSTVFWAALLLNLFNLIPVLPLDGGRVLLSLTADLPRALRTPAVLLPVVVLVVLLLVGGNEPILVVAAMFLAFSMFATRMALRRDAFYRWMTDVGLALSPLRGALRDVSFAFSGAAREDVDGGVPPSPMEAWQVAVALLAYSFTIALLVGASLVAAGLFGAPLAGVGS